MVLKSKMQSMNRGAQHRDRDAPTKFNGYENNSPQLRKEDLLFLGGTKARLRELADELKPIIKTYAKGGARKPARVSHLLNKAGKRTPSGDFWNPRLAFFLLNEVFRKPDTASTKITTGQSMQIHKTSNLPKASITLSTEEMNKRLIALKEHFTK